jgi:hypothetical protein
MRNAIAGAIATLAFVSALCPPAKANTDMSQEALAGILGIATAVDFYGLCPFKFDLKALTYAVDQMGAQRSSEMFRAEQARIQANVAAALRSNPAQACELAHKMIGGLAD